MKKQLKQFGVGTLMAFALCVGKVAFAGERGGNGGDALICPDGVYLLDYFEATKYDFNISLPGTTLREKSMLMIERLSKLDEIRSQKLKVYLEEMLIDIESKEINPEYRMKYMKFSSGIVLADIDDSFEIALPKGCEKKQLVIQKMPVLPQERFYEVDKDIWDKMELEQKAMTLTHEAWYRLNIEAGALDSRFTRYINGLFSSKEADSLGLPEYVSTMGLAKKYSHFKEREGEAFPIETLINGNRCTQGHLLPSGRVKFSCRFSMLASYQPFNVTSVELDLNGEVVRAICEMSPKTLVLSNLHLTFIPEKLNWSENCKVIYEFKNPRTEVSCRALAVVGEGQNHRLTESDLKDLRLGRMIHYFEVKFLQSVTNEASEISVTKQ